LVEVVVVVTAADADLVTVLVCAVVAVVVAVVVSLDVVGDFVVVTVFVCEDVLVVLVEVAALASSEVVADFVRDPDCDGVVRVAVLVRVMLLLRLFAAPDPHAAQRTAHVAASAALNVQRLGGVVDPGTRVSRWALETAWDAFRRTRGAPVRSDEGVEA
jgi:hypothetical protein